MPAALSAKESPSDIFQETFVEVQKAFSTFEGTTVEEACSWLRRIFLRQVCKARRHFIESGKRCISKEVPIVSREGQVGIRNVSEHASVEPLDEAIEREATDQYWLAFAQLSNNQKRIMRLRSFEDMSFKDIADLLGCTEEAARKAHFRAMRKMCDLLGVVHPDGCRHSNYLVGN